MMSPSVRAKIKALLVAHGYTTDDYQQLYKKDDTCVIVTTDTWNIGSLKNTSWPGITGNSLKLFKKYLGRAND